MEPGGKSEYEADGDKTGYQSRLVHLKCCAVIGDAVWGKKTLDGCNRGELFYLAI